MKRLGIFLSFVMALLFPVFLFAQTAKVIDLKGEVLVKQDVMTAWQRAKVNMLLGREAEVETKKNALCTLAFDEEQKNILTIKENSRIKIENVSPGNVFLPEGRVFSLIKNLSKGQTFQIRTPTAIAGARGTGWITGFTAGSASALCFEDTVFMQGLDNSGNPIGEQDLNRGSGLNVGPGGVFGGIFTLRDSDYREWNDFSGYVDGLSAGDQGGESDDTGSVEELNEEQQEGLGDKIQERNRAEEEYNEETPK
jgi:hypothetical protein